METKQRILIDEIKTILANYTSSCEEIGGPLHGVEYSTQLWCRLSKNHGLTYKNIWDVLDYWNQVDKNVRVTWLFHKSTTGQPTFDELNAKYISVTITEK